MFRSSNFSHATGIRILKTELSQRVDKLKRSAKLITNN